MSLRISPEQRRWIIVAIIFVAIMFNYLDRQIVAILKPILKVEFELDDAGYALLLNVFTIGYATMYPVSGWLVDRFGPRLVMGLGIVGWSVACIAGGLSRGFAPFAVSRAFLGLAEPTNFPAQLKVVAIWFPGRLRATANSLCVAGGTLGAIIAPPIVAWLAIAYGWRSVFLIFGVVGLSIAALWWLVYRDPPAHIEEEARATTVTRDGGAPFTWPQLWRTRSLWGILLIRFVSDPVWYFCLFWLPGYLQEDSGLTLVQIGMFGWIPFLAADLGSIASAAWSDRMVRRGGEPLKSRKKMLSAVCLLAPLCALTPFVPGAAATLIIFSLVAIAALSWLFSLSVVIAEAFPVGNVASVLGIAGGFGAAGAVIFNYFVGELIGSVGAAQIFFVMAFLHPLATVILWTMVREERTGDPR